jgi:predicted nucleic-acid-binding protein
MARWDYRERREVIGLDTNVVVRMLVADDPEQVERVRTFLDTRTPEQPAYISSVVLAETIWVLERKLKYQRKTIAMAIEQLLATRDLRLQFADRLQDLLQDEQASRGDLADYLVAWSADAAGCSHTVTFDRRAARIIPDMELLT